MDSGIAGPDVKVQEAAREALGTAAVQEVLSDWSRERGRGEANEGASHKCRVAVEVFLFTFFSRFFFLFCVGSPLLAFFFFLSTVLCYRLRA